MLASPSRQNRPPPVAARYTMAVSLRRPWISRQVLGAREDLAKRKPCQGTALMGHLQMKTYPISPAPSFWCLASLWVIGGYYTHPGFLTGLTICRPHNRWIVTGSPVGSSEGTQVWESASPPLTSPSVAEPRLPFVRRSTDDPFRLPVPSEMLGDDSSDLVCSFWEPMRHLGTA